MEVKGVAYLARKSLLEAEIGTERMNAFLDSFREAHPELPKVVLATSRLPIELFMQLNDAIVEEFFDGDEMSYWRFGRQSGDWALGEGPYRRLREQRSLDEFVGSAKLLYDNYFTVGGARAKRDGADVDLWLEGIPRQYHHVYFEYAIVGYFERGLELVSGKKVDHERVEGFSAGDLRVHYRYRLHD